MEFDDNRGEDYSNRGHDEEPQNLKDLLDFAEKLKYISGIYLKKSEQVLKLDPHDFIPEAFDEDYAEIFDSHQKILSIRRSLELSFLEDPDYEAFKENIDHSILNYSKYLENLTIACINAQACRRKR